MSEKPTIYIVDDDDAMRKSLSMVMRSADFESKTYATAQGFLNEYDQTGPGCLLLDVRMPGMTGLELQTLLPTLHIQLPVIIMTGHGDVATAVRAMKAGAIDFIEKPFEHESLLTRIHECVNQSLRHQKLQKHQAGIKRLNLLTPREREVMDLLAQGKINKSIAHQLGISIRTVEAHRANLMTKLHVHSLADVIRIALLAESEIQVEYS